VGGQLSSGNTQVNSLHADVFLNRNRRFIDEVTFKGSLDYESSAGGSTMFKVNSSFRYGISLSRQLYQFAKIEADYDRFQDIGLRLVPALGLGYWFADEQSYKAMTEGALGYQKEYRLNRADDGVMVVKLSAYLLLGAFSNDLDLYAIAGDLGNHRIVNEAVLKSKLNDHYAFKCSLRDEYNSRPAAGVQNNDLRLVVGLEYSFEETRDWIF
jgi:putative salt-induced outer membrane protein YdiY